MVIATVASLIEVVSAVAAAAASFFFARRLAFFLAEFDFSAAISWAVSVSAKASLAEIVVALAAIGAEVTACVEGGAMGAAAAVGTIADGGGGSGCGRVQGGGHKPEPDATSARVVSTRSMSSGKSSATRGLPWIARKLCSPA